MHPCLTADQLARDLAIRDLTDPEEGPHGLQLLVDHAVRTLARVWGCEVRTVHEPRIVPLADNYDALRFPPASVTREARYTRYVDTDRVLRTHTTAMVPPALRALAAAPTEDILLVCPGITYRRDAIDRLHTGTPHQLDLWRITNRAVGEEDLREMIAALAGALLPGRPYRSEPRTHPYTLDGRQVDAEADGGWVEVWECGLAHPEVLGRAGLVEAHGLALGMGLDRLLMLRKGIPDIRLLRSTDTRVSDQMLDLGLYRPVSRLPAIRRDLSVAVDEHDTPEDIGDRVREALGREAAVIEEVAVLSETPIAGLPTAAVARLGMEPGQKNVLIRLVIRPHDRTLTDDDANRLRQRVSTAVHQGSIQQ